jgi:transcription elongation factor Elf1
MLVEQLSKASIAATERWKNLEYRSQVSRSNSKPPLCPLCSETDISKFYLNAKGHRKNAYCKECHKIRCKDRWNNKSDLDKKTYTAAKYGLSPDAYVKLYESQEGKCAICNEIPTTKRGLHTDHCHTSGKVRGLLCHHCNTALGSFKDNINLLNKAVDYLNKGK